MLKIGQRITIHRKNPLYNQIQHQAPQLLEKKESVKNDTIAVLDTNVTDIIKRAEIINTQTTSKKVDKSVSQPIYHKVKKGETLSLIAKKYKTTVAKVKQLNNLKSNNIKAGQNLRVK